MSSSSSPSSLPTVHINYEDELGSDLEKDDVTVLEKRYSIRQNVARLAKKLDRRAISKIMKSQTQWTRALDAVQEHFSSHVSLDGVSHRLPENLYALKVAAKHSWVLYKKRECERRKRIRKRLEKEKEKEVKGEPANVLLSMVDMCESCQRLYVSVNLFWGMTLCDSCYFNPDMITHIMKEKVTAAKNKMEITQDNVVDEVLRTTAPRFYISRSTTEEDEYQAAVSHSEKTGNPLFSPIDAAVPVPPPPSPLILLSSTADEKKEVEEEEEDSGAPPVYEPSMLATPFTADYYDSDDVEAVIDEFCASSPWNPYEKPGSQCEDPKEEEGL